MKELCADNALHFVYSLQEPTAPLHVWPSTEQVQAPLCSEGCSCRAELYGVAWESQ